MEMCFCKLYQLSDNVVTAKNLIHHVHPTKADTALGLGLLLLLLQSVFWNTMTWNKVLLKFYACAFFKSKHEINATQSSFTLLL